MSFYRDLYETFNGSQLDDAKRLFEKGEYRKCIHVINEEILENTSLFLPSSTDVEGHWYVAQCYSALDEFNDALWHLNYVINHPSDDRDISKYKSQARTLQNDIKSKMSGVSSKEVRYPTETFREFVSSKYSSSEIEEVVFEGLSNNLGCYYVRNSFGEVGSSDLITIYLHPVSETYVELFVYFDFIFNLFQLKEEDTISYNVVIRKFPQLKELMELGKNGSTNRCTVFKTTDYARDVIVRHKIPVLGMKVWCRDSVECRLSDFSNEIESIFKTINKLSSEVRNFDYSLSDKAMIASIAFAKGALGKVASEEIAKPAWEAFKSFFRH